MNGYGYTYLPQEPLQEMLKAPVEKKQVGIIRLEMVREGRSLYGMGRLKTPREAAQMVGILFRRTDREQVVVLSLDSQLTPAALEIVAIGGLNSCSVEVSNIFKHAILNNSAYIICFHNHPSGVCSPSREDRMLTERLERSGAILGIPLVDHIIIGGDGQYMSFAEQGWLKGDGAA